MGELSLPCILYFKSHNTHDTSGLWKYISMSDHYMEKIKKNPYVHSTSFVCFLGTTSGKNNSLPATTIISRSGIHSFDELKIIVKVGQ